MLGGGNERGRSTTPRVPVRVQGEARFGREADRGERGRSRERGTSRGRRQGREVEGCEGSGISERGRELEGSEVSGKGE